MDYKLILIPVITTLLTTAVIYFKESLQNKEKIKREVTEKKLTQIYNKLFVICSVNFERLQNSLNTNPDNNKPIVNNKEFFDKIINDTRVIVHENIHLLNQKARELWFQIEIMSQQELYEDEGYIYEKYDMFLDLLVEIVKDFKELTEKYNL